MNIFANFLCIYNILIYNHNYSNGIVDFGRLRDSLSLITGDPVGIEEITNAVSSAFAIESSSIKKLPEDYCSNVFVVCVGYLLNNSSHLHAEVHSNMFAVKLA